jgi:SET domain-containing protein
MNTQPRAKSKPPHKGVYTRLRRSRMHGVGVFAIRKIARGTYVFPDDKAAIVWIEAKALRNLPKEVRRLYEDFCIIKDGGRLYGCPKTFNQLTVPWYLNSSKHPNVRCNAHYEFYALRDIKRGEELTVDYTAYSEPPRRNSNRARTSD